MIGRGPANVHSRTALTRRRVPIAAPGPEVESDGDRNVLIRRRECAQPPIEWEGEEWRRAAHRHRTESGVCLRNRIKREAPRTRRNPRGRAPRVSLYVVMSTTMVTRRRGPRRPSASFGDIRQSRDPRSRSASLPMSTVRARPRKRCSRCRRSRRRIECRSWNCSCRR